MDITSIPIFNSEVSETKIIVKPRGLVDLEIHEGYLDLEFGCDELEGCCEEDD